MRGFFTTKASVQIIPEQARFLLYIVACEKAVKTTILKTETEQTVLLADDIFVEKQYSDENEFICGHFDHSKNSSAKGINLLNMVYHSKDMTI